MNYIAHERVQPLPAFTSPNIRHAAQPHKEARAKAYAGPVAGAAKKGQPNRKKAARLDRRRADYSRMIAGSGKYDGYRRPGSMQ